MHISNALSILYESHQMWTVGLCGADSDGDGRTNGEELGDSQCTFDLEKNVTASESAATGHPGICEPIDSQKCREYHLGLNWDICNENSIRQCEGTTLPSATGSVTPSEGKLLSRPADPYQPDG